MENYINNSKQELNKWKIEMSKDASFFDKTVKVAQNKFNDMLPDKYHEILTATIKNMIKVVLIGSKYTTGKIYTNLFLAERDKIMKEKTKAYSTVAMLEGAGTGAGGIFLGLSDFPLLLSIKMKFLYEIAAVYGFDTNDYKERLYVLYIFQLAFSGKNKTKEVFLKMNDWDNYVETLPYDIDAFDWRSFQQEYRDYIDLAKLLQLMPGVGAVVGAHVNRKLINKLSETAMYAYHMRLIKDNL